MDDVLNRYHFSSLLSSDTTPSVMSVGRTPKIKSRAFESFQQWAILIMTSKSSLPKKTPPRYMPTQILSLHHVDEKNTKKSKGKQARKIHACSQRCCCPPIFVVATADPLVIYIERDSVVREGRVYVYGSVLDPN